MKLIQLYEYFLVEGLSNILYHRINIKAMYNILKSDEFRLATSAGTDSDSKHTEKGDFYYMSFARSLSSGYFRSSSGWNVFLILDGRKLMTRYKGGPVEYWNYDTDVDAWGSPEQHYKAMNQDELEDRIFHDKPTIPNASKYIDKIYVLLPHTKPYLTIMKKMELQRGGMSDEEIDQYEKSLPIELKKIEPRYAEWFRKSAIIAKSKGIEIYLFKSMKDIMTNNIKSAIPILDIDWSGREEDPYHRLERRKAGGYRLGVLVRMYYTDNYDDFDRDAQNFVWDLAYKWGDGFRDREMITSIKNDIHNYKTADNKWVNQVVKILQKEGMSNVVEFMEKMSKKWKDILDKRRDNY